MTSRAWAVSALVSLPFFPLAMHGPNVLALLTPRNAGEVKSFTPDSQIGLNGRLRPAAGSPSLMNNMIGVHHLNNSRSQRVFVLARRTGHHPLGTHYEVVLFMAHRDIRRLAGMSEIERLADSWRQC